MANARAYMNGLMERARDSTAVGSNLPAEDLA